jgi:putative chitinase
MSFNFDFTQEKLAKCLARNKNTAELFEVFNEVLPRYEITTIERVAAFLAQCGHESADFTVLKENLNYSAEGLAKVFPKRFPTVAAAQPYNRNPEKIANKIYSDRMGNGPEASGEGYKFRGRGAIQLTGKENYTKFANSIDKSLDEAVAYTETLAGAIESACWFWSTNKLNALADATDIVALTKRINGGTIGLEDRKHHFENNLVTLSA